MIGLTMKKPISKLFDLEIDEVSVVDRGANQHSLIAFSKSLNTEENNLEESMSETIAVFSETGEPVDLDSLKDGDVVFDAEGNAYAYEIDPEEDDEDADDRELASVGKSLSDSILEEFSKAVSDRDREAVIAKAMKQVEIAQEEARIAKAWAEQEHDARVTEAFVSKAAEYNLPVAPEVFGPILKALAETLSEEQLDVLDNIFNSVGDSLYNEVGYVGGGSNSSVLDEVDALAAEYVGKSDLSREAATTAMFEANPAAYDAYIAEMGR